MVEISITPVGSGAVTGRDGDHSVFRSFDQKKVCVCGNTQRHFAFIVDKYLTDQCTRKLLS